MRAFRVNLELLIQASDKTSAHKRVRRWLDELEADDADYIGMRAVEVGMLLHDDDGFVLEGVPDPNPGEK